MHSRSLTAWTAANGGHGPSGFLAFLQVVMLVQHGFDWQAHRIPTSTPEDARSRGWASSWARGAFGAVLALAQTVCFGVACHVPLPGCSGESVASLC
jgi:hypothetical protein